MNKTIREVRGRIPQELKIAFEIACVRLEVSQSHALEEAIKAWLERRHLPTKEEPLPKESAQ
jgi:hypothetical protein